MNNGQFPSNIHFPERMKHYSWSFNEDHTQFLYSPRLAVVFPLVQISFPPVVSQGNYPIFLRVRKKSVLTNPTENKMTTRSNVIKRVLFFSLKRTTRNKIRKVMPSDRNIQLVNGFMPSVINHLS